MTLHADALAVLRSWRAPTAHQEELRERFVAHLERHPDGLSRSCAPAHVTASVLVFDSSCSRLLLTLHAKANRWLQVGGHTEPGDRTLAGAALREAVEESGLGESDLALVPEPVLLDAHHVGFCGVGGTWHLDVMFRATARSGVRCAASEESLELRWWPVDDLPDTELEALASVALGTGGQSTSSSGGGSTLDAADHPSR